MERRGRLAALLVAGWPRGWQRKLALRFSKDPRWARFLDRWEPVSDRLVHSSSLSEFVLKIGDSLRPRSQKWQQRLHRVAFRIFESMAARVLRSTRPAIYHYRCCYGGRSVEVARQLGAVALCDHSVAHPLVADFMVDHEGAYPPKGADTMYFPLSRKASVDLDQAEYVLVNSDFVKETCMHAGMDASRIYVVYLGVDDKFLDVCPVFDESQVKARNATLLFAGGWQVRKGIYTLMTALEGLDACPWELDVIGGMDPEVRIDERHIEFFRRENVRSYGILPRSELAARMADRSIFVFPSYCEGSARVIFEAMACGCAVITTPNSGSIVRHGENGWVVPPGNVTALQNAVAEALANPDKVAEMGWRNAQLVRSNFRQSRYADAVEQVYATILAGSLS